MFEEVAETVIETLGAEIRKVKTAIKLKGSLILSNSVSRSFEALEVYKPKLAGKEAELEYAKTLKAKDRKTLVPGLYSEILQYKREIATHEAVIHSYYNAEAEYKEEVYKLKTKLKKLRKAVDTVKTYGIGF